MANVHIRLDDKCSFVALDGDRVVGCISVYKKALPPPLAGAVEGYINIIEVAPEYRQRGIARRMIRRCIRRGRTLGFYQLRGWSSEDKIKAIPMWQSLGFGLTPIAGQEVNGYFATIPLREGST